MFQCCMPACLDIVGGMKYGNYEKTSNAYLSKYMYNLHVGFTALHLLILKYV